MAKRKRLTTEQRRWSRNISNVKYRYNKMLRYMKETGWDISNVPSFDSFNLKRTKKSYEKAKREYRNMKSIATKKMDGKLWSYREFDRSKRKNRAKDARNKRDGFDATNEDEFFIKKLEQNIISLWEKMVEHEQPKDTSEFKLYFFEWGDAIYSGITVRSVAFDKLMQELEIRRAQNPELFAEKIRKAYEENPDFLTPEHYYNASEPIKVFEGFIDMFPDDNIADQFIEELANSSVTDDMLSIETESNNPSVIIPADFSKPADHTLSEYPEGFFDALPNDSGEFYTRDGWDDMMDEFFGNE